jgi:hypothetical protein
MYCRIQACRHNQATLTVLCFDPPYGLVQLAWRIGAEYTCEKSREKGNAPGELACSVAEDGGYIARA